MEVLYYEKDNGECPTTQFLEGLPEKARGKVMGCLTALGETRDGRLSGGRTEVLSDWDVCAVRVEYGGVQYRVFYFIPKGERRIVVLNGYVKKTQKADAAECRRAATLRAAYEQNRKRSLQ